MSTFCQRSYHRKCQQRGVGGQKRQNLVNVVCTPNFDCSSSKQDFCDLNESFNKWFYKNFVNADFGNIGCGKLSRGVAVRPQHFLLNEKFQFLGLSPFHFLWICYFWAYLYIPLYCFVKIFFQFFKYVCTYTI